jgi:uncharacterized phage protein (TIGR01671 family)
MDREMLFRGKVERGEKKGEWVEGYIVKGENTYILTTEQIYPMVVLPPDRFGECHMSVSCYIVDPATVGQYIGLRDNKRTDEFPKGQRIFEGDIVKYKHLMYDHFLEKRKVIYSSRYSSFIISGTNYFPKKSQNIVVIGNIYDNPERLEASQ